MNQNLFRDPDGAGVFHLPAGKRAAVLEAAAAAGTTSNEIHAAEGLDTLLEHLGRALGFPDWYGANLDALHDCLSDPDLLPPGGAALLLSGLEHLQHTAPEDFAVLMDVFRSAVEVRREAGGSPLWILVDAADPDLPGL